MEGAGAGGEGPDEGQAWRVAKCAWNEREDWRVAENPEPERQFAIKGRYGRVA